jgi:hypothetical protein
VRKIIIISLIGLALLKQDAQAQVLAKEVSPSADSTLMDIDRLNEEGKGNFPKVAKEALQGLSISGYYRFVTNVRKFNETYAPLEANKKNIFVGDDAQIPQFMLQINGNVSSNTSFGTDLFMWSPMTGAGQIENVKGLNLGVSMYGNFATSVGNFNVRTGGINWHKLSPFTFQQNTGYNRFSLFERNPWDPITKDIDGRYSEFYTAGEINQDVRWGNQAFQGIIVEGAELPENFSFTAMYGKTQFDGGLSATPNASYGGRLKKTYNNNKNTISFNSFNNRSQVDSISEQTAGFNIHTLELLHHFKNLKVYAELGAGRRFTNESFEKFGEAISIKLASNVAKKFPVEMHLFRISPRVLNNNSVFINSAIQQTTQANAATQPILIPVSSAVLPVGQMANNRQGIELNAQLNVGRFKNSIGYSNSTEMENLSSQITYGHAFNNIALSHFYRWNFPSEVGPYQNLNKIYRAVFETLNLTEVDANGRPLKKKFFNAVEISSKYKTSIGRKDLYIFYLGNFNSVQNTWGAMVNFTEEALIRTYCHQLETYMTLSPRLVWTNYGSYERNIANYQTQVDAQSKRPKNQTGYSFATGFDIQMSKSVGLYLRQRYMKYWDSSFALDRYQGWESTIELKAFF